MTVDVPEPRVEDAERALLVQSLAPDVALQRRQPVRAVLVPGGRRRRAGAGRARASPTSRARSCARRSRAGRRRTRTGRWARSCSASATHVRLFGDRACLTRGDADAARATSPRSGARSTASRAACSARERYSSDIPDAVLRPALAGGRLGRACAAMAACGRRPGDAALAATLPPARGAARGRAAAGRARLGAAAARRLAVRPGAPARRRAAVRLADRGAARELLEPGHAVRARVRALRARTAPRRAGSCATSLLHGSRLLGLVRAGAYALYGDQRRSRLGGTDQVYGINVGPVPRRRRRGRPARAQPLRPARGGDDAGHVRRGRGGERRAAARGSATARCTCRRTAPRTPRSSRRCGCCSSRRRATRGRPTGCGSRTRRRARGSRPGGRIAVARRADELRAGLVSRSSAHAVGDVTVEAPAAAPALAQPAAAAPGGRRIARRARRRPSAASTRGPARSTSRAGAARSLRSSTARPS